VSVQARPRDYAAAIYDLAFEPWVRQLGGVEAALKKDPALLDGAGTVQDRLQRLSQAVPGGLDADVRKFLGTILEAGLLDQLDTILAEFQTMVRRAPERTLARVTSAVPLTEGEKEALQDRLSKRFGADLEFRFEVDEALIGGVHLRVGDQVIDGSVAGKLAALRDHLAA
jgi:F-type H+-transporting ATPase subunit delta